MKKTALHTLIEKLELLKDSQEYSLVSNGIELSITQATELLAKEREDIVEAFNGGGYFVIAISDSVLEINEGAHEYLTETFENK